MPELPEVEVVRRGLETWVRGRRIADVDVLDPRSVRRHSLGFRDFRGNLTGTRVLSVVRRGKFLWMPLLPPGTGAGSTNVDGTGVGGDGVPAVLTPSVALVAHLGMSGQLLVEDAEAPDEKHLKVRLKLSVSEDPLRGRMPGELRFVDQRIFGGMFVTGLVSTVDGHPGGLGSPLALIPAEAAHIARDPLDPAFDFEAFHGRLRARRTALKRAILDQSLVSGIGNIYADEALWTARLHFARATDTLRRPETQRIIDACRDVMRQALAAGGTSFDSLYVNVNGASGYFGRSLNAYGRAGALCRRCAGAGLDARIRRDMFMNRSSFSCPRCQPRPRNARW
jgi:formamidopyrimidine-DNA glycosylase